jgi:rRNA maturation endonuclease Nob1
LGKKGMSVWLFSSLTFIALLHLIEAISVLFFNNEIRLLQLYPFINEKLQAITPITYFWVSAVATFILWGITCGIAFTNPVETFLNTVLSDAKTQGTVETQLLEEKSEILDSMNETIESNNEILAQVKDLIYNVRTEVKEIRPLRENFEKMKTELGGLRKETRKLEDKVNFQILCPACGKPLLPEFKICPYCGEGMELHQAPVITLKDYK